MEQKWSSHLGEEELENKQVPVKVMSTGKEVKINLEELYDDFDSIYRQINNGYNSY